MGLERGILVCNGTTPEATMASSLHSEARARPPTWDTWERTPRLATRAALCQHLLSASVAGRARNPPLRAQCGGGSLCPWAKPADVSCA